MRDTMGKRIAEVTDEERVRLITAVEFNDGMTWWTDWLIGRQPCGCLEGTIAGGDETVISQAVQHRHIDAFLAREVETGFPTMSMLDVPWRIAPPSVRYPKAVRRFGKERVVRAIKARAAKPVRVAAVCETVEAGRG